MEKNLVSRCRLRNAESSEQYQSHEGGDEICIVILLSTAYIEYLRRPTEKENTKKRAKVRRETIRKRNGLKRDCASLPNVGRTFALPQNLLRRQLPTPQCHATPVNSSSFHSCRRRDPMVYQRLLRALSSEDDFINA